MMWYCTYVLKKKGSYHLEIFIEAMLCDLGFTSDDLGRDVFKMGG